MERQTLIYANHVVSLPLDIYATGREPLDKPVFLYFHPGGLVAGDRKQIPPWLVQACLQRQWPLVSPSYRLLPQAGAQGLLEDVKSAYRFAQLYDTKGDRKVIVGGASAGFFMAALIATHLEPKPLAMFCYTGIPTFRHAFFNSAQLLMPEAANFESLAAIESEPVSFGRQPASNSMMFKTEMLTANGAKATKDAHVSNPQTTTPGDHVESDEAATTNPSRACLYDCYLYQNRYPKMLESVDTAFINGDNRDDSPWPKTVFLQGDQDYDVSEEVVYATVKSLGPRKADLVKAKDCGHLFGFQNFLEDSDRHMEYIKAALNKLDDAIEAAYASV